MCWRSESEKKGEEKNERGVGCESVRQRRSEGSSHRFRVRVKRVKCKVFPGGLGREGVRDNKGEVEEGV